jgi:uncharacterized membrane protein
MSAGRTVKPKLRIEAFSDLIFGLALSIGALTLIGQQPASFEALMAALGLYAFSFLILVSVWRSYSTITSVLPAETETLASLNIVLLFLVSVEPFLFNQLNAEGGSMFYGVSIIYAVDLAAMFLILAFFNNSLVNQEKSHAPKDHLKRYRFARNYDLIIAAVFLISILPFFATVNVLQLMFGTTSYGIPLRVFVWILALILGWGKRIWEQAANHSQKQSRLP